MRSVEEALEEKRKAEESGNIYFGIVSAQEAVSQSSHCKNVHIISIGRVFKVIWGCRENGFRLGVKCGSGKILVVERF